MLKRVMSITIAFIMAVSFTACKKSEQPTTASKKEYVLPQYEAQQFEISALSGPKEFTEEAFLQYKDAGFNTLAFSIHTGIYDSDNRYYLGSNCSQKALELCKKIGLYAYVAYGDSWATYEIEGDDYFSSTPFSQHNYYGEYMDIIKGIRIIDEPKKEKMLQLADDTLINDFKSVYGDKKYMINLIPETAVQSRDFTSYEEMLTIFGENILSKFKNPYVSVDVYPFATSTAPMSNIVNNYNQIAECAKKYNAETTMILQSSTGQEFLDDLCEGDIRFQAYLAIAFGADNLQYYCYAVPVGQDYSYCMLQSDNKTPSKIYYYVQEVNNEVQKFASAVLAYDWNQSIGVSGAEDSTYNVCVIEEIVNEQGEFEKNSFKSAKHFVSASGTQDIVVSQFTSEKHGEAYMIANFAENNGKTNTVDVNFKDCNAVGIYGGEGYNGEVKTIELDNSGKLTVQLNYGEGVFITPLQ